MFRLLLAVATILFPLMAGAVEDTIKGVTQPDGSLVITLSPARAKACDEQGGCIVLSEQGLVEFLLKVRAELCSTESPQQSAKR